jgi:hypothetical protein
LKISCRDLEFITNAASILQFTKKHEEKEKEKNVKNIVFCYRFYHYFHATLTPFLLNTYFRYVTKHVMAR